MRLSKKAEYALKAVVAMGRRGQGKSMQIQELSEAEHIPVKFLEQILLALRKGDVLRSKRGVGGGYQLAKPAAEISLGEIVELMDGPFIPSSCLEPGKPGRCGCGRPKPCGIASALAEVQESVRKVLGRHTVAQVIERESTTVPSFDI